MEKFNRTNYCGEITINDLNKNVSVIGWVSKFRNHGGIMFIDLRDRTGIVQILVNLICCVVFHLILVFFSFLNFCHKL